MLQRESRLVVADNSGAKEALIMQIPGNSHRKTVGIGDVVKVVIKKAAANMPVKKSERQFAVIVRVKKEIIRADKTSIRFDDNACVLIDQKDKMPKGTRIFGPVAKELKDLGFSKIVSLAAEVL